MQYAFAFHQDHPPRPRRPERLFFSLLPDTATSIRVRQLGERFKGEFHLRGKPLAAERLHVSLRHVGDFKRLPNKVLFAASRSAEAVSMPPFEVTFRFVGSFSAPPAHAGRRRRWPLVLFGEGLALLALHKVLGTAMVGNGLRTADHFTPHMTLLYGSRPVPLQAIEPIRFAVEDFVLIHSERGLKRYNTVGRWPLRDESRTEA